MQRKKRTPANRWTKATATRGTLVPATLVQEEAGIRVGIASGLPEAAEHAAAVFLDKYDAWHERGRYQAWGHYKRQYFVVAVGGGNTLKAQYHAMLQLPQNRVDWIAHVRFFFLEESTGEGDWESPEQTLIDWFLAPLVEQLSKSPGHNALEQAIEKASTTPVADDPLSALSKLMLNSMDLSSAHQALRDKNRPLALKRAHMEAERYQLDIQNKLGATMVFNYIASGIGKTGALGAFSPYMPELRIKEPAAVVIKKPQTGALRIALNRGVLTGADCVSLIVSGNLKLRALGRFEMEETADFEQTVMETPLRMLRENYEIAERVYLFADEQALNFDETRFRSVEKGESLYTKAETRAGDEANGPHILLLHGFMGLFSFTNLLIRLPSAWTISALHRGTYAKKLNKEEIFPHYAHVLRQAILTTWNKGQAVPIAGHSIAGIISDHLLLSLLPNYEAPITPYEQLKGSNRKLVDALRTGGIVHLATWAPVDGPHAGKNIQNLLSHVRKKTPLDYSGFERVYREGETELRATEEATVHPGQGLHRLNSFLENRVSEPVVNSLNLLMRSLLNYKGVQQRMLNTRSGYVLRLVGNRLLKTASFYGLCKEINAAMHDPVEYQKRHLRALDIILEYDIPFLCIIHEDDFLVSAKRHAEEHKYLLTQRKEKEGVSKAAELNIPARFVTLRRGGDETPVDPLNPHLMLMATSAEGNDVARQITAAMTRFVNENIARAVKQRQIPPVGSVKKWLRENTPKRKRVKAKVA